MLRGTHRLRAGARSSRPPTSRFPTRSPATRSSWPTCTTGSSPAAWSSWRASAPCRASRKGPASRRPSSRSSRACGRARRCAIPPSRSPARARRPRPHDAPAHPAAHVRVRPRHGGGATATSSRRRTARRRTEVLGSGDATKAFQSFTLQQSAADLRLGADRRRRGEHAHGAGQRRALARGRELPCARPVRPRLRGRHGERREDDGHLRRRRERRAPAHRREERDGHVPNGHRRGRATSRPARSRSWRPSRWGSRTSSTRCRRPAAPTRSAGRRAAERADSPWRPSTGWSRCSDYEDFARIFAGIGKAAAVRLPDGAPQRRARHDRRQRRHPDRANRPTCSGTSLRALRRFGDPLQAVQLAVRELVVARALGAGVRVHPDYLWDVGRAADPGGARSRRFGFERRELGEDALARERGARGHARGPGRASTSTLDTLEGLTEEQAAPARRGRRRRETAIGDWRRLRPGRRSCLRARPARGRRRASGAARVRQPGRCPSADRTLRGASSERATTASRAAAGHLPPARRRAGLAAAGAAPGHRRAGRRRRGRHRAASTRTGSSRRATTGSCPTSATSIGYRPVHEAGEPGDVETPRPAWRATAILVPRREVANTIRYRRRKGTLALLELLARDVAGWPARAVEFYRLLGVDAERQPPAPAAAAAPSTCATATRSTSWTARSTAIAHTVDVRRLASRHDPGPVQHPGVGLFVWRLRSYSVTRAPALLRRRTSGRTRSRSACSATTRRCSRDRSRGRCRPTSPPSCNLPGADPTARALERLRLSGELDELYGAERSFAIWTEAHGAASRSRRADRPGRPHRLAVPAAARPGGRRPGARPDRLPAVAAAADAALGHVPLRLQRRHRRRRVRPPDPPAAGRGPLPRRRPPPSSRTIADALKRWRAEAPRRRGDRDRRQRRLRGADRDHAGAERTLQLRAANRRRPVLRLLDWQTRPARRAPRQGRGRWRPLHAGRHVVTGRGDADRGRRRAGTVRHCTLVPGWGLESDCEPGARPSRASSCSTRRR